MDRDTLCEYPLDPSITTLSQEDESSAVTLPTTWDGFSTSPSSLTTTSGPLEAFPGPMEQIAIDDNMSIDWDNGLNEGFTPDFWSAGAWNSSLTELQALGLNITDGSLETSQTNMPGTVSNEVDNLRLRDLGKLTAATIDWQRSITTAPSALEKPLSPISARTPGSETAPSANSSPVMSRSADHPKLMTAVSTEDEGLGTRAQRPVIPDLSPERRSKRPVSSLLGTPHMLLSPEQSRMASPGYPTNFSDVNNPEGSPLLGLLKESEGTQNSGLFGVKEIAKVICDYPKQMLRHNFWSPFVHHKHYRCSKGGLAEPIAIALCCVSANLQSVESSLAFVCNMINTERERLVKEFPGKSENLEDAMAALHAMCIYQIETILAFRSQKLAKQRISGAELYHHFLLKMTRRLCQEHGEALLSKDNNALDWQRWTMSETLRRTTFLVDMVNELSYHTNALNPVYYESLQKSLVLDMPLPAPDSMWHARNEHEWTAARDATGWSGAGVLTLRDLDLGPQAGVPSANRSSLNDWRRLDNIEQISKLIISSAKHVTRQ